MTNAIVASIIIPVYNDEKFIAKAIDGALAQTHPGVEVIVVDDGSTDGTLDIIEGYKDRIVYVRQRNHGVVARARNIGASISRGRYICFLDSDDTVMPDKIRLQADFMDAHPDIAVCYIGWLDIDVRDGSVISDFSVPPPEGNQQRDEFPAHFPVFAGLIRKEIFEQVGRLDESLKCVEDSEFYWRLWADGHKFKRIVNGAMACRGVRSGSKSKNVPRHSKYAIMAFKKHFARMGRRVSRELRILKLGGVWMKQAGYYISIEETDKAIDAVQNALRYNRHLLREPTSWLLLIRQLDTRFPPGSKKARSMSNFQKAWPEMVSVAREAMSRRLGRNVDERQIRLEKSALAYAISREASSKGRFLETASWFIRAFVIGRGRLPRSISWRLVLHGLGTVLCRVSSLLSRKVRRVMRRRKGPGQVA
ncbi:glycosyltransferase [bacterium]|nr:glycosyltransferase [bacterium]